MGQVPILVPVTSVSQLRCLSCGSASTRSSAFWHTPAGHPGALQLHHAVVAVLRTRPRLNGKIKRILMDQPVLQCVKARIVEPFAVSGDLRQCVPFVFGEAGNRNPAVLALTAIGAMRRRRLIRRAVAAAAELALVGRSVEDGGASQENARFTL